MADDGYTILHRKDERGVIVESKVFGPDDEVPEGFGAQDYQPVYDVREDTQEPVAESVLTPWSSPVAKGTWVGDDFPAVEEAAEELDDEESEDGELTGAEQEAAEQVADDSTEGLPVPPKGGPGSGQDVWAAYAANKGVEVPEGATRDEIIAACQAAGVPVD